jgi:hypothetical protein
MFLILYTLYNTLQLHIWHEEDWIFLVVLIVVDWWLIRAVMISQDKFRKFHEAEGGYNKSIKK